MALWNPERHSDPQVSKMTKTKADNGGKSKNAPKFAAKYHILYGGVNNPNSAYNSDHTKLPRDPRKPASIDLALLMLNS